MKKAQILDFPFFIFIVMVCIGILLFIVSLKEKDCVYKEKYTLIASLDLKNNVEGEFILGSGYINNEVYYYFYKMTDGGLILDKLPAENVLIRESDTIPRLIEMECGCKVNTCEGNSKPVLVIPLNTIKKDYKVN